jgi:hypothetical protein
MAESGVGLFARALAAARYTISGTTPSGWFGPGVPLAPQAPEQVKGRAFDYPVALNINYQPRGNEPQGFDRLKIFASNGIVAMLIQRQKDLVSALNWTIKPRVDQNAEKATDKSIDDLIDFFHSPDGEHDWNQWISAVLDQLMVLDAVTIYVRPNRGGGVYSCEVLDGATIKPLLDDGGRRPIAPDPAYQQVLKGLPAVDYTADELIYFPQSYRPDRVYGYSRVEQAIDFITQSIARLKYQNGYWTHGNIGDGYFETPDGWTPEDILVIEDKFNSMMTGSVEARRSAPFVPHGTVYHTTKEGILSDAYDEWLIRCLCFPFGVAPQPFLKQSGMGHGSAGTEQEAAKEGGVAPLMQYVERLINRLLRQHFARPDLEFSFVHDRELNQEVASKIDDTRLRNGSSTLNEVLDRNGEQPIVGGDERLLFTSTGWVTLDSVLHPPEPIVAPPVALPAANLPEGGDLSTAANGTPPVKKKAEPKPLAKAADEREIARLAKLLTAYLAAKATALVAAVSAKLGKEDDSKKVALDAIDEFNWGWDDLPEQVEPYLAGVAATAGSESLSEFGLFDAATLKRVTAKATAYAQDRAAELVGMRWKDGELIVNPNAEWAISDTTRSSLRTLVTNAMDAGSSNQALAKAIREATAFSSDRAEMIARTETGFADKFGNKTGWRESGVVAGRQWMSSADCCDECQEYDGTIIGIDDEFDWGDEPHPNCVPGDTLVSINGEVLAVSKRAYNGNLVVISTASGKNLSCTPNHPILTNSGWVAAGVLNKGDCVISSSIRYSEPIVGSDDKYVPSRIEDVAEAFARSSKVTAAPVPVAAEDFHGDGEGSEVAIIWADRTLRDRANATACKKCGEPIFGGRDVQSPLHDGSGVLDFSFKAGSSTNASRMGSLNLSSSLAKCHLLPFEQFGRATVAPDHTLPSEQILHETSANTESLSNSILGNASEVSPADRNLVGSDFRKRGDAALRQSPANYGNGNASFTADLSSIKASEVEFDTIVDVSVRSFSGHVYNLEISTGFYVANGIVTHNCRCTEIAVLPEDMPDGENADDSTETE